MLKKNFMKSIACGVLLTPLVAMATGYLENPQPGAVQSGLSVISGWHCTAKEVEVFVDGVSIGATGVGSVRNDAVSVCGHNESGYAVLYNYNIPEPGEHTIQVYADGALLEARKFNTVRSGGVPFLSGKSASTTIANFPENGRTTTVEWSQAKQSFVVIGSADSLTLDGTYSLRRVSIQTQNYGLIDTEETNGLSATGTMVVSGNSYQQRMTLRLDSSSPPIPVEVNGNMLNMGYYLYDRINSNQVVVVERGSALITSLLFYEPTFGWSNEIDYWVKVK